MSRKSRPHEAAAAAAPEPEEHAIDEVPDAVRQAARRAFASRDRRASVLALATDTLVDGEPESTGPRRLSFAGLDRSGQVHVTVLEHGEDPDVSLVVECPWETAVVEQVECAGSLAPLRALATGRWLAGPVSHGLFRARVRVGDAVLHTAWVRV
jgi:hypothetical protein